MTELKHYRFLDRMGPAGGSGKADVMLVVWPAGGSTSSWLDFISQFKLFPVFSSYLNI